VIADQGAGEEGSRAEKGVRVNAVRPRVIEPKYDSKDSSRWLYDLDRSDGAARHAGRGGGGHRVLASDGASFGRPGCVSGGRRVLADCFTRRLKNLGWLTAQPGWRLEMLKISAGEPHEVGSYALRGDLQIGGGNRGVEIDLARFLN